MQSSSPAHELARQLLSASDRLQRRLDGQLSSIVGISYNEYRLITALNDADQPKTRIGLAQAVGLSASGVTRALQPLEKIGYLQTVRDARDARSSRATLTKAGRRLISNADAVVNDVIADTAALSSLSTTEREAVMALLKSLSDG